MTESLIDIDHRKDESLQIVLPSEPVISINNSFDWKNIKFSYHESHGFDIPEHTTQQHAFLIIHKFDNQSQRRLGGQIRDEFVKSGDVIFCPAGVPHAIAWDGEAHYSLIFIEPQCFDNSIFQTVDPDKVEMVYHFAQSDPIVYVIGQTLKSQSECEESASQLYLDSVSIFLSSHILQNKCSRNFHLMEKDEAFSYKNLQKVINYIDLRLGEKLCIEDLSKLMGMSLSHFHRLFTNSVGVSPYQYVMSQRLTKAKKLLKRTKLEVAEIAELTGFNSSSHFISTFQKHLSVTPKQFRNML